LASLEKFRTEFLNNKEIFSLLISAMKLDGKPRYSIFEFFLKVSEFDIKFLSYFQQGIARVLLNEIELKEKLSFAETLKYDEIDLINYCNQVFQKL
jgi:hypothetical protein